MKILHVIDFYSAEIGSFCSEAVRKLAGKGHEITVLTSDRYSTHPNFPKDKKASEENIKVKRFHPIVSNANRAICPGMIKEIFSSNPDIIHAYGLGFFSSPLCGYLRLAKKTPLVLRADFNIYEKPSLMKAPFNFFWRQMPIFTADAITVHMKKMRELLRQKYVVKPEKIEIMPHGIDFKKFNSAKGIREGLRIESKFVVLNVSRADGAKDPIKIINALPALKKITNDFVFIHIGAYYQKDYYDMMREAIGRLGLRENVRLLGTVPHEKLPDYYKSADLYVQSSNEESFCLSTLEAMASGLPVIATKTGAIGYEWFDNYDYWFGAPEELGKKLAELFEDKQKRNKVGKMLESIARRHDWSIVIKKLEKIYEKAMVR